MTGSGPAPLHQAAPHVTASTFWIASFGVEGGELPTWVLTAAEVLFSSFVSGIVLSGSTTAVFVRVVALDGAVTLIVIVPFWPALTAPPVHVTVPATLLHVNRLVVVVELNKTPNGKVSTTLMPVAFAVPMLFTVRV